MRAVSFKHNLESSSPPITALPQRLPYLFFYSCQYKYALSIILKWKQLKQPELRPDLWLTSATFRFLGNQMHISAGRRRVRCVEYLTISRTVWQLKGQLSCCSLRNPACRSTRGGFNSHTRYFNISFHLVAPITVCTIAGNSWRQVSTNKASVHHIQDFFRQWQSIKCSIYVDGWTIDGCVKRYNSISNRKHDWFLFPLNVCAPVVIVV